MLEHHRTAFCSWWQQKFLLAFQVLNGSGPASLPSHMSVIKQAFCRLRARSNSAEGIIGSASDLVTLVPDALAGLGSQRM